MMSICLLEFYTKSNVKKHSFLSEKTPTLREKQVRLLNKPEKIMVQISTGKHVKLNDISKF